MIYGLNNQLINFLSRHILGQRDTHQFLQPLDRCWRSGRIHLCQDGFWVDGFGYGDGCRNQIGICTLCGDFFDNGGFGCFAYHSATNQSDRGEG